MLINRNDQKGKALNGFVGLFIFTVVFLFFLRVWPPKASVAQPVRDSIISPSKALHEEKEALKEYTNQKKSENLDKAIEVLKVNAEVKKITARKRKSNSNISQESDNTIILKYNGGFYDWPVAKYQGQVIVDLDSVLVDIETQEDILITEPIYNHFDTAMIQTANEQISAWKKFKNLFKRKR